MELILQFQYLISMNVSTYNTQELYFEVSNKKNEKQSDVVMKYSILIQGLENLPVELKLYKYDYDEKKYSNEVQILNNESIDEYVLFFNSDNDKYKVVLNWTNGVKDYRYSKTIDYLKIKIKSEQID